MACLPIPKYLELKNSIAKRNFPLVVFGPSGTGKTTAIIRALGDLGMRYKYVDISRATVRKPLVHDLVILTDLCDPNDIRNIRHTGNIIIETNLPNIAKILGEDGSTYTAAPATEFCDSNQENENIQGRSEANTLKLRTEGTPQYTFIKFNRVTQKIAEKHGISNFDGNLFTLRLNFAQPKPPIDFYQFLGKIFYKKFDIQDIICKDLLLHYACRVPILDGVLTRHGNCTAFGKGKKGGQSRSQGKKAASNVTIPHGPRDRKRDPPRRSIIESSSSDETYPGDGDIDSVATFTDSSEMGVLDEFVRTENSCEQFATNNETGGDEVSRLKSLVRDTETHFHTTVSFSKSKAECYIFENFLSFCTENDIAEIYDCLSLVDVDSTDDGKLTIALLQCLKESEAIAHQRFYGFKPCRYEVYKRV